MKRKVARTTLLIAVAALCLSLAPAAQAARRLFECQSSGKVGIHPHGNPYSSNRRFLARR